MRRRGDRSHSAKVALISVVAVLASLSGSALHPAHALAAATLQIRVLSNRADLISGGDALVQVELPAGLDPKTIRTDVDGRDVGPSFATRSDGRYLGLVTGLKVGPNVLTATLPDGSASRLTITNHPIGGPVFAGPQVHPWLCAAPANGLGPPTDAQCNVATIDKFDYVSSVTGQFASYDPSNPPGDVATTTTDQGVTVPYIVREELGSEDRGLYDVAVLFDPAKPWSRWAPQPGWNHKVMYLFGGGSQPQYIQHDSGPVLDDNALSRGFMVASNSLNVHGFSLNDNVAPEAMMMLKEHIIEGYGDIRHVIGEGCSGGGLEQYMIADMYPGLIDGIIPTCSFPDLWNESNEQTDCHLLTNYFNNTSPQLWPSAQDQAVVSGHETTSVCAAWEATYGPLLDPAGGGFVSCGLPAGQTYNAQTNPTGARCDIQDYQVAIWGRRPQDGFAKRPTDNVGLQYGLNALQAGLITADQFADMNAKIGGVNIDYKLQPQRIQADPGAVAIAYRTGQVTNGHNLANVPIIDLRGHDNEEFHNDYHSYEIRARLDRENGGHGNQVIFLGPENLVGDPAFQCAEGQEQSLNGGPQYTGNLPLSACTANPLVLMDQWLGRVEADTASGTLATKVVRDKPAAAVDSCWISGSQVTDFATCQSAFPYYGSPRMAAGGPVTNDVMKCQLKPFNPADYNVTFTTAQLDLLHQAFPTGVCDPTRPSVDSQPTLPWLTFAGGPGGQPLGPPPVSMTVPGVSVPEVPVAPMLPLLGLFAGAVAAVAGRRRIASRTPKPRG